MTLSNEPPADLVITDVTAPKVSRARPARAVEHRVGRVFRSLCSPSRYFTANMATGRSWSVVRVTATAPPGGGASTKPLHQSAAPRTSGSRWGAPKPEEMRRAATAAVRPGDVRGEGGFRRRAGTGPGERRCGAACRRGSRLPGAVAERGRDSPARPSRTRWRKSCLAGTPFDMVRAKV